MTILVVKYFIIDSVFFKQKSGKNRHEWIPMRYPANNFN